VHHEGTCWGALRTNVPAYALVLRVVSMRGRSEVGSRRTLTRLFAAGAGISRARAAGWLRPAVASSSRNLDLVRGATRLKVVC
jgi:hypothetical protein